MRILDFIFPKRCVGCGKFGDYICTDCFTQISFDVDSICLVCNKPAIDGITHPVCLGRYSIDGMTASISYKRIVKRLIYSFKYKPYLADLEKVLSDLFYEGLIQSEQFHKIIKGNCVFVPIPLHHRRLRERGYNQAEILAENLGKRFSIPVLNLLERVRFTQSQVNLKREDRQENIKGVFAVNSKFLTLNSEFILIDDVITSGATMKEAANVLKRAGCKKVWGVSLAHGQ